MTLNELSKSELVRFTRWLIEREVQADPKVEETLIGAWGESLGDLDDPAYDYEPPTTDGVLEAFDSRGNLMLKVERYDESIGINVIDSLINPYLKTIEGFDNTSTGIIEGDK